MVATQTMNNFVKSMKSILEEKQIYEKNNITQCNKRLEAADVIKRGIETGTKRDVRTPRLSQAE